MCEHMDSWTGSFLKTCTTAVYAQMFMKQYRKCQELTLSNGVRILRRNAQLHNYILPGNLSHGLNLHCYVKTLGGDSGDELGK